MSEAKFESKEMPILGTFVIFRNGQHMGTKETAELLNELVAALELSLSAIDALCDKGTIGRQGIEMIIQAALNRANGVSEIGKTMGGKG